MNKFGVEVGDWVRYMKDNRLIIANVEYFGKRAGGYQFIVTDQGEVSFDSVLEVRGENEKK